MKKILIFLIISLLLSPSILAQIPNPYESGDIDNQIKNIGDKVKEKLDYIFSPNSAVKLPEPFLTITHIIFSVKGEIYLHNFILLIGIWFMLFFILIKILYYVPLFKGGIITWAGAIIITLLISITGVVNETAKGFLDFFNIFGINETNGFLALILSVFVLLILFFGATIIINLLGKKYEEEDATKKGRSVAKLLKLAEVTEDLS